MKKTIQSNKYCLNCGKRNTNKTLKPNEKCKFCGEFLTKPVTTTPLQKQTSKEIYKDIKVQI